MKKKNLYENILLIGAGVFAASMVIFPEETEGGAKEGLFIWLNSVVPILFPFFIFSDFMKRMGIAERAPVSLYPLVMAFMSGYPMGAKIVGDLVAGGKMSKDRGKEVLSYSLVTGPAFILGTLRGFLGSSKGALIVALSHYIGALLNGAFFRGHSQKDYYGRQPVSGVSTKSGEDEAAIIHRDRSNPVEKFTAAIISATGAMAIVLAYLVVFMIGIEFLTKAGLFSLIKNDTAASFIKGILEMTIGSKAVCLSGSNMIVKTVLVSFFVSFGGISVIGQSSSMVGKSKISFFDVLQIKISHGLISGIIAVILGIFVL